MATEKIPLVSVIIPMYNSAKFIPQTLESLLYQTMKDFEVVVVDDCSTDNSIEVVESFIPRFAKKLSSPPANNFFSWSDAEDFSLGDDFMIFKDIAAEGQLEVNDFQSIDSYFPTSNASDKENDSEKQSIKLNVIKLSEHTGTPGFPRNIGIQMARGKYIAFLDSDDLFIKTALEELTNLAEEYNADVVHLQNNFVLWGGKKKNVDDPKFTDMNELTNPKNLMLRSRQDKSLIKPTLDTTDIGERINKWLSYEPNGFWATWLQFYRRDFLIANQITFPSMLTCEDMPVAFKALCLAKNYLIAPNTVYILRPRDGSVSRDGKILTFNENMHKRIGVISDGFKEFERIMDKINFFKEHPDYRYAVLEFFVNARLLAINGAYKKYPAFELNEIIKKIFQFSFASFTAYLFNTVNTQLIQIMQLQQENTQLKETLEQK